jgi:hypothetical protein
LEKFIRNYELRYYISILGIIIGLTLFFVGKYYFNNNLIFSIGLGFIIGGLITCMPNRNTYKNNECRKNFEQTYDERFIEISQKSSGLAINIIFVLIGVLAIITYIIPIEAYKLCTILILLVFIIKYFCYEYYNHKYEDVEEISKEISNGDCSYLTINKFLSIFSIVIVLVGTLFSFTIANVYIGSFFMQYIGITDTLYFKIADALITLGFLILGNYSSKTDYPKLNKILRKIFRNMVLISVVLMLINSFLCALGTFK